MGCHFLLQGIFPTQGSSLDLLHCRQFLYHVNHQGSPTNPSFPSLVPAQAAARRLHREAQPARRRDHASGVGTLWGGGVPLTDLARMQNRAPPLETILRSAPCVQASYLHGTHKFFKRVIWALRNQVSQSLPERTTLSPGSSLGSEPRAEPLEPAHNFQLKVSIQSTRPWNKVTVKTVA